MSKIILIFLLVLSLYADKQIEEIIPECVDSYNDYSYYVQRAKNETSVDLAERWFNIALKHKENYDRCVYLFNETKKLKGRERFLIQNYYRSNPYQQQIQK